MTRSAETSSTSETSSVSSNRSLKIDAIGSVGVEASHDLLGVRARKSIPGSMTFVVAPILNFATARREAGQKHHRRIATVWEVEDGQALSFKDSYVGGSLGAC